MTEPDPTRPSLSKGAPGPDLPPSYGPEYDYPEPGLPPPSLAPGYYGAPGYPAAPTTNGKAVASLATSLAGILFCWVCAIPSIVGLVLGIIAMGEVKRTGEAGHGMALAGVIISTLTIVPTLLGIVFYFFFLGAAATSY